MSSFRSFTLLLFLLSAPLLAYGYTCNSGQTTAKKISESTVTMTEGCTFTGDDDGMYVELDVSNMVQDAHTHSKDKVSVSITQTVFTNMGLLINGYVRGTMGTPTVPLEIVITGSTFNTNRSMALYINGTLPPRSTITIKENTISTVSTVSTSGFFPVATNALALTQSRILFEKNVMTNYHNKSAIIWTETATMIKDNSSIEWVGNTLNATSCIEKCDCAILSQTQTTLTVSGANSHMLWSENTMSCDAGQYSRIWYQHESKAIVQNNAKIVWGKNNMTVRARIANGYPYIWYMDSVTVSNKGNITFINNQLVTEAPFYCRIWYQRGELTVIGEQSVISWQDNNISGIGKKGAGTGDLSLWFQGSNLYNVPTTTTVTQKGLVQWANNKVVMFGGYNGYVWRQQSTPISTMTISESGAVLMVGNSISFTGARTSALLWYQHKSVQSFTMNSSGMLAWWNNTMSFVNGAETSCLSCLSPKGISLTDSSSVAFEHNTISVSTAVSKDMSLFEGPFQMRNLTVKINRNDFTFAGNERSQLSLLWNATGQISEASDCTLQLCRNKYNMVYMKHYPNLVEPSSLVPFIDPECPYTPTRTFSATRTFPATPTAVGYATPTASATTTAVPTITHTPTIKLPATRTRTIPTITTTTTTTTTTTQQSSTTNSTLPILDAVGNRAGAVAPGNAEEDNSKSVCIWCIIVPIVIGLLLLCCCLIIVFCCCRRRRDEHKVLDDVEANGIFERTQEDEANERGPCHIAAAGAGALSLDDNNHTISNISGFSDPQPRQQEGETIVIVVNNPFEVPKPAPCACEESPESYSDSD